MDVERRLAKSSIFATSPVLIMIGLGLFLALITAQSSLALACVVVFSVTAGAKGWSYLSLARMRCVTRVESRRVFAGEALRLRVDVENTKLLPVWVQVVVPLGESMRTRSGDPRVVHSGGLLSFQRATFDADIATLRRGVYSIGPVELQAGDPLGFFHHSKQTGSQHVIVYPRLIALNAFTLSRRDFLGRPGADGPIEDPTYIHGTRDYQPGRPARYIHWKASARHGRIVEKMCEATARERVVLFARVDGFSGDQNESFERCLEVAASLAVQLDRQRQLVSFVTNGRVDEHHAETSRSQTPLAELLETMARLQPVPAADSLDILGRVPGMSWTVTVVCFLHTFDAASQAMYQFLKRRRLSVVTILCGDRQRGDAIATNTAEKVFRLEDLRRQSATID